MNDYATTAFENIYNKAKKEGNKLKNEAKFRRVTAYILKGIAVFSGIALATGLSQNIAQVLGIIVAIVVAIDELFANHKRLTVMTTASYAYDNLFDKIEYSYNHQLQEKVISVRENPNGDTERNNKEAYKAYTQLNQEFSTLIYENTKVLKEKIQESDLAFLSSVAQDKNKQNLDLSK